MNQVHVCETLTEKQRAEIIEAIEEHNENLFDMKDYVEPKIFENLDFTYITDSEDSGYESVALINLLHEIVAIIEER